MRDMYEDAGEFTTNMLNKFWDINYEDSENYNDVLKFLNQAENFRTFNDGLTEFIFYTINLKNKISLFPRQL